MWGITDQKDPPWASRGLRGRSAMGIIRVQTHVSEQFGVFGMATMKGSSGADNLDNECYCC